MRIGIDVNKRFEYSFPDDVDPKTIYVIKPLTSSESFDLGQYIKDGKLKLNGEAALATFIMCVAEVKNFSIKKGDGIENIISAKESADLKRVFNSMDKEDITLIFEEALRVSKLTKEMAKN